MKVLCPVCQCGVGLDSKNKILKHTELRSTNICYGSFMPSPAPESTKVRKWSTAIENWYDRLSIAFNY
jgi:hypothetical protein